MFSSKLSINKMNTLQNRLKLGFAIYIAGSFTLFLQFFLYLLQSNIASTTDFAGYGYSSLRLLHMPVCLP